MSSGRHLGGIATAGTPGGGDDESGFRSQPESSRISPITGSRQSLIFGRHCLTMDIHLYPFEMTVSPSYRRVLVRRRRGQGVVEPSSAALLFASDRLKAKATHAPVPVRYLFQNPQSRARQQLKTAKALRSPEIHGHNG